MMVSPFKYTTSFAVLTEESIANGDNDHVGFIDKAGNRLTVEAARFSDDLETMVTDEDEQVAFAKMLRDSVDVVEVHELWSSDSSKRRINFEGKSVGSNADNGFLQKSVLVTIDANCVSDLVDLVTEHVALPPPYWHLWNKAAA